MNRFTRPMAIGWALDIAMALHIETFYGRKIIGGLI